MVHNKILSKITVKDLREAAIDGDFDWKQEILPNLDEISDYVDLNTDKPSICGMAIHSVVGTSRKRKQMVTGNNKDDIHKP